MLPGSVEIVPEINSKRLDWQNQMELAFPLDEPALERRKHRLPPPE